MRKVAMWLGILVIVCMGVFPPWTVKLDRSGFHKSKPIGYHLLFDPPANIDPKDGSPKGIFAELLAEEKLSEDRRSPYTFCVDFQRLSIQWISVAVVTAGLMYTFPGKKKQVNCT